MKSELEQDARIEHAGGVELGLGGAQGGGEGSGPLAVVPGPMVTTHGVVMGDRAAALISSHCSTSPPRTAGASTVK